MAQKFYWFKLKKDFFEQPKIKLLEASTNGKEYLLMYLKMLCSGLENEGSIDMIGDVEYTPAMISALTNTNIDIVRTGLNLLVKLGMIEVTNNEIIMSEMNSMIGSETSWAAKKAAYRAKLKEKEAQKQLECKAPVEETCLELESDLSEKEEDMSDKSIEKEKEIEIDNNKQKTKRKKKSTSIDNIEIPEVLDTEEFREEWEVWKEFRKQLKKSLTPIGAKRMLNQLAAYGPEEAIQMIEVSICNGWTGVYERNANKYSKSKPMNKIDYSDGGDSL